MSVFLDASCPACGRRYGWCCDSSDPAVLRTSRPACPSCGHKVEPKLPRPAESVDEMLSDLLAIEEGLSSWEVNFVDSVDKWRRGGRTITAKQAAKVKELWERL